MSPADPDEALRALDDHTLVASYRATGDALAFREIYRRFRAFVRAGLEDAGLEKREAELRVGEVFVGLEQSPGRLDALAIEDALRELVRKVAGVDAPARRRKRLPRTGASPFRFPAYPPDRDGFYGSGA